MEMDGLKIKKQIKMLDVCRKYLIHKKHFSDDEKYELRYFYDLERGNANRIFTKYLVGIFILLSFQLNAQDIIFKKTGEEIQSNVLEVTTDLVKYKKFDNLNGPQYTIQKSELLMIKYANGTKDIFLDNDVKSSPQLENNTKQTIQNQENIGEKYLSEKIKAESGGLINLIEFTKTNGVSRELAGQKIYTLEYKIAIQVNKDCYKTSSMRGYYEKFYANIKETDFNRGRTLFVKQGTVVTINGELLLEDSEKGWRGTGYTNKNFKDLGIQPMAKAIFGVNETNPVIQSKPLEKIETKLNDRPIGYLQTNGKNIPVIIRIESVKDEIGQGTNIANFIIDIAKRSNRFTIEAQQGLETSTDVITITCNAITSYPTTPSSSGSALYLANMNLNIKYLYTDTTEIIKEFDSAFLKVKAGLLGAYVTKLAAFEQLKPLMEYAFGNFIYSCFPITAFIDEITELNKKELPKKVKISVGSSGGVSKDMEFFIQNNDASSYQERDLIVSEVFEKYSICKVKNNEEFIKTNQTAQNKIKLTTNFILVKNQKK